jgi:DNA end-binding protein Ku
MLHGKDLSRIREVFYCAKEDKPVDRDEIVKGYEYQKDRYVVIDPEDLEKITPPTATVMEILQFVQVQEIDPIFFETSYYVAPEGDVRKPYSLLLQAMQQSGYDALAKVVMHGREHIVILRPREKNMMLHTMYFVDELHQANEVEVPKLQKVDKKELDMAKKLIEILAAPFQPERFKDEYKKSVQTLIEKKRKGQKISLVKQPKPAPVIDLMQALQASLAKTAKPKSTGRKTKRAVA